MAVEDDRVLHGRWVHSYEEDTPSERVFRPAGHSLPPSRGRMSFELSADGTYVQSEPGPADVPQKSTGRWSLDGDKLLLAGEHDRPAQALQVVSAGDDALRIKK